MFACSLAFLDRLLTKYFELADFILDEMGRAHILLDEMGSDEIGLVQWD